jgi:solute carrier family 25 2-oxodicarboxylate transporter 21
VYRGITPLLVLEAPKRATKFASNDLLMPMAIKAGFNDGKGKISQTGAVVAGTGAGIIEAHIVVPFELVKIRLQAKEYAGLYSSTLDALTKIVKTEGLMTLYNGLEATIWRHGTWNAGYFGSIHLVRTTLPEAKTKTGNSFRNFVAGAVAGTVGTILNTPFDVVKSRIQMQRKVDGVVPKYNWTIPGLASVFAEEGPRALYKGFGPKVLRLGPGGGILLVVYEVVSSWILAGKNSQK